jgi:hypothetical protein
VDSSTKSLLDWQAYELGSNGLIIYNSFPLESISQISILGNITIENNGPPIVKNIIENSLHC